MATRTASAEWKGDLTGGTGTFSSESGHLGGNYSFQTRFGDDTESGTNPEELIAAAQACCYSMQLSAMLAEGGNTPDSVNTDAKVQLLKQGDGFAITKIDIVTVGRVPGLDADAFEKTAQAAKEACLISKALAAVPQINVEARLAS